MQAQPQLTRAIGRTALVLMIINSIIGAGIFGLPSKIFALAGSYSLLAFLVCATVVLIFVACFAEVSTRFQQTGGPYVYVLEAFGRETAFGMGWLLLLSRMFNYAALINLLVANLAFLWPLFEELWVRAFFMSALSFLLAFINHLGVRNAARFSTFVTLAKLAPLAFFIGVGLLQVQPQALYLQAAPPVASFSQAVLLLVFAFGGFESVLINTGEIKDPQKHLAKALFAGIAVVATFYCFIQAVCMGTLPQLDRSTTPVADAATLILGKGGGWMIVAGATVSITGTLNVLMLSGSRLPYAFSLEKQLPSILSYVHPRLATPTWSLWLFAGCTLACSLAWGFLAAITVGAMIRLLVYALVCLSLIRLRRQGHKPGQFRLKGGVFFAWLGVALSVWLLTASTGKELRALFYCLLAGVVVYVGNNYFEFKIQKSKFKTEKAESKTESKH